MATDPNTVYQYNQNADEYHRHVSDPSESIFHAYYEKPAIRAELPKLDGLDVLSIGCGSGLDARWLADNGARNVTGVDISSGLVDIARKNNPEIMFEVMDMEKLNFKDETFDLAYSSLAIHYVDDWTHALKEAYRILKQDGLYIFSCGHPIDSAMEYETQGDTKFARVGRMVNLADKDIRIIYGDYLAARSNGVRKIGGTLATVDVVVYHRPISKMIEQITTAGFSIEKMVEPQPISELKEINPGIYEQLSKIPSFMIWVLRK